MSPITEKQPSIMDNVELMLENKILVELQKLKDDINIKMDNVVKKEDLEKILETHSLRCPQTDKFVKVDQFVDMWHQTRRIHEAERRDSFNKTTDFAKNIKWWIMVLVGISLAITFALNNVSGYVKNMSSVKYYESVNKER